VSPDTHLAIQLDRLGRDHRDLEDDSFETTTPEGQSK
jgi:hypothetical protein